VKKRDLAVAVLKFAQGEYRSDLGESLDLQNARHNRGSGKMTLKKLLVGGDLLDADYSYTRLELDDLIHQ